MTFHFYVVKDSDKTWRTQEFTDLDEAIAEFKKEIENGKDYASLEFLK
jgi:hypothetical protein